MNENVMHIQDNVSLVELNQAIGSYSDSLQQISGEVNNHLAQALQQLQQQKEILNGRVQQAQTSLSSAQVALNSCYISQTAAAIAGGYVDCSGCEAAVQAAEAYLAECQAKYTAACSIVAQAEAEIAKYHSIPEQRLNALATTHTQAATRKLNGISADTEDYLSDGGNDFPVGGMCLAENSSNQHYNQLDDLTADTEDDLSDWRNFLPVGGMCFSEQHYKQLDDQLKSSVANLPTSLKIIAAAAVVGVAGVAGVAAANINATLKPAHEGMESREDRKKSGYTAKVLLKDGNTLYIEEKDNGIGPSAGVIRTVLNMSDFPSGFQEAAKRHDLAYGTYVENETPEQSLERKRKADIELAEAMNEVYNFKTIGDFAGETNKDDLTVRAVAAYYGLSANQPLGDLVYAVMGGDQSLDSWKQGQEMARLGETYKKEIEQQLGRPIDTSSYYFVLENPMCRVENSAEKQIANLLYGQ